MVDAAAGDVEDLDAVLHPPYFGGAEHAVRLLGQRRMDGDDVRLRQQLVERHALRLRLGEDARRNVRIVRDHAHAERQRAGGDALPDPPEADHPESLAVEFRPHERRARPLAALHAGVRLRDVAAEREHHGHGVLGGRHDVGRRGIDDEDAAGSAGLDVDVVEPHAGAADDAQPRADVYQLLRHGRAAVSGHVGGAKLRAEAVGQGDGCVRIDAQGAREIDLRAIELIGGDNESAGRVGQLRPRAGHVDRCAHARLLLRDGETDQFGGKHRIGMTGLDHGLGTCGARIRQRDVLHGGLDDRGPLRIRCVELTARGADATQARQVEQRLRDARPAVIGVERRNQRGEAEPGDLESERLGIEGAVHPRAREGQIRQQRGACLAHARAGGVAAKPGDRDGRRRGVEARTRRMAHRVDE